MRKINGVNVGYDRRFDVIKSSKVVLPDFGQPVERVVTPADSVIRTIYRPDPVSKLPSSDLAVWISDSVNPEIREFIKKNLLSDTSSAASPAVPDGVTDDVAFALMRQNGESQPEYVSRVNKFFQDNKSFVDYYAKSAVSSDSPAVPSE